MTRARSTWCALACRFPAPSGSATWPITWTRWPSVEITELAALRLAGDRVVNEGETNRSAGAWIEAR